MADKVIYFPSIHVPNTEWFSRVLLYWDSVATIVPTEYLKAPEFVRSYTSSLIKHGLLTVIPPDAGVREAPKYRESFLTLVDSLGLKVNHDPHTARKMVDIHVDKAGLDLALDLRKLGLAEYSSGGEWDWFKVEKQTGNLLMAYLAAILAQRPGQRMDPITDSADCLEAFTRVPVGDAAVVARLNPIRSELLDDLLPAPVDPVDPTQLAKFKERYRSLLTRFRTTVEQRVVAAAAIEDAALHARSVDLMKTELTEQRDEIIRRMQEHKWHQIGFGTLMAVAAAGVALADAFVTGGALTAGAITLTKASATLGLTSAIYAAFEGARTPAELLASPMAYAALAHRKLG